MGLFDIGHAVATPAALAFCNTHNIHPIVLLQRHHSGDFGDLCEEDQQANRDGIAYGGRIFSSYTFPAGRVWVITEADRSYTTILLPEEY